MPQSLFQPIRTLGLVCNALPVQLLQTGPKKQLVLSTGFAYEIYDGESLQVQFSSKICRELISAFTPVRFKTAIALLNSREIILYSRFEEVFKVQSSLPTPDPIIALMHFGDLLCAFNRAGMEILNSNTGYSYGCISFGGLAPMGGIAGAYHHPPGIVNTILVGGQGAELIAYDVVKMREKRRFVAVKKALAEHVNHVNQYLETESVVEEWTIDCIAGSPGSAEGVVVAVSSTNPTHQGVAQALVVGLDIENDQVLFSFEVDRERVRVSCMSIKDKAPEEQFARQENREGDGFLLLLGCQDGSICVHDLIDGELLHTVLQAHPGGVRSMETIACGGDEGCIFMTSGLDNALVYWHLTAAASKPVVLKSRRGLVGHLNHLAFYDEADEAKEILASSSKWFKSESEEPLMMSQMERLPAEMGAFEGVGVIGKISFILKRQDGAFAYEKGLHKLRKMFRNPLKHLPPVIDMTFCRARHYDWPAVITCHKGQHEVMVWSALDQVLKPVILEMPRPRLLTSAVESSLTAALADLSRVKRQGTGLLERPNAVSATISGCGHFTVVGYENGMLCHFNLQSRSHVGRFSQPSPTNESSEFENRTSKLGQLAMDTLYEVDAMKMSRKRKLLRQKMNQLQHADAPQDQDLPAHKGPVRFVAIRNSCFVYSACQSPEDLTVASWDLQTKAQRNRIDLKDALKAVKEAEEFRTLAPEICKLSIEGSYVVTALQTTRGGPKSLILAIDPSTETVVRHFGPIDCIVNQVKLSPSGEWLCVSSLSPGRGQLRVYDLSSAELVDWTEFPAPITDFTFHPSGAFLLTAHAAPTEIDTELFPEGGVYVWANLDAFGGHKEQGRITAPVMVPFPPLVGHYDLPDDDDTPSTAPSTPEALSLPAPPKDLSATLSRSSKWSIQRLETLLRWEKLKEEGKVEVSRKLTETETREPFFLYQEVVSHAHDPAGWGAEEDDWVTEANVPSVSEPKVSNEKDFLHAYENNEFRRALSRLMTSRDESACLPLLDKLESLSAPAIHRLLATLGPLAGSDMRELEVCLWVLSQWTKSKQSADFVQVLIKLFFEFHGSALIKSLQRKDEEDIDAEEAQEIEKDLRSNMEEIFSSLSDSWDHVSDDLDRVVCYIKHLTLLEFE